MKLLLILFLLPYGAAGMDIYSALSMLESGNNDRAVGSAGEISRYQILKQQWRTVTKSADYRNPALAKRVAEILMNKRIEEFQRRHNRPPGHYELYVLWNAPAQAYANKVSGTVSERARRFANLCAKKDSSYAGTKLGYRSRPKV